MSIDPNPPRGTSSLTESFRLMGYPDAEIARLTSRPSPEGAVERVRRILATFDGLEVRKRRAVSVLDLAEDIREAIS